MKLIIGITIGIFIGVILGVITLALCIGGSQKEMPKVNLQKTEN